MRVGVNQGESRVLAENAAKSRAVRRLVGVMAVTAVGVLQAAETLPPADEGPRDLSFVEFRTNLLAAVDKRDAAYLQSVLHTAVAGSAAKDSGAKAFVARWQPQRADSEVWPLLKAILNLGGAYVRSDDGVQFCAPYVFTHFPAALDRASHGVLIQKGVVLKRAPSAVSADVAVPDYAILKMKDWRSVADEGSSRSVTWLKVTAPDGGDGYVRPNAIRGPNDYHVCFVSDDKSWRLVSFGAVK